MKYKLILLLFVILTLTACRKGEQDPAISLLSRKARLSGKWYMSSGTTSIKGGNVAYSYVLDGSGFKEYVTPSGGTPVIYVGKYTLKLTINKDGTFWAQEATAGAVMEITGTWKFNKGVGDKKNKECVIFQVSNVSSGFLNDFSSFNMYSNCFEYSLVELKNKEIIMESSAKVIAGQSGDVTYANKFTFSQAH
jgi:hypothetical protein